MNKRITVLSISLLVACGPHVGANGRAEVPVAVRAPATTTPKTATPPRVRPAMPLAYAMHEADMTEVVLDPRGESALTQDSEGGLRLWPTVRGTTPTVPVALPEREPVWSTLARAADDTFVVATIDTLGGARVSRIALGERTATRTELFEIPADDPQFELHVLDGGERIVALGKDHRVRLFDTDGAVRSEIDRTGFIPWQLRVSPTKDGRTPMIAVLTQPVRAQAIELDDDRLEVVGEARMIALDQSPNRNDLALSPDGTKVAALRRPQSKGRVFALQLIDLASGERKVILGELDAKVRPRLHLVDDARALLEAGTGKGFWLDLGKAVPKEQAEIPMTPMTAVPLAGAPEDLRMQVTVVAGIRAVPTASALLVDPLDAPDHVRLAAAPVAASAIALDATGTHVAWNAGQHVVVEEIGGEAQRFTPDELRADTANAWVELVPSPSRQGRRAAEAATVGLPLVGGRVLRGAADPSGRFVAVVQRAGETLGFAGLLEPALRLSVYDAKRRARLWTRPMSAVDALAWSASGDRLAVAGGGVRVIDADSGESLLVRTDVGVTATVHSDAG